MTHTHTHSFFPFHFTKNFTNLVSVSLMKAVDDTIYIPHHCK